MNYVRITRGKRYNWVNGVRSIELNAERLQSLWNLPTNPIERARRTPEEIEAARRLREERAENRRIEKQQRILAERAEEVHEIARQLAAAEIGAAREHVVQAEREAEQHREAIVLAQVAVENLQAVIRQGELREAAIRESVQQRIDARPEMHDQACMANPYPAEDGDVFLAIPGPFQVAAYHMVGKRMDGEICLIRSYLIQS